MELKDFRIQNDDQYNALDKLLREMESARNHLPDDPAFSWSVKAGENAQEITVAMSRKYVVATEIVMLRNLLDEYADRTGKRKLILD
jgi:hypothetical protein